MRIGLVYVVSLSALALGACSDSASSTDDNVGGSSSMTSGGNTSASGGSEGGSGMSANGGSDTGAGGTDAGGSDAGGTDAGGADAGGSDSGGTDAGGADMGGSGTGGAAAMGMGGSDAMPMGNQLSVTVDGEDATAFGVIAMYSAPRLSISGIVGKPNTLSSVQISFELSTGTFDCTVFPLEDPTDPYLTFQAQPAQILDPTKAMDGSCSFEVSEATENHAVGTFEATLGNGTDDDIELTNGMFDVTY